MKNLFYLLLLTFVCVYSSVNAQGKYNWLPQDSWAVGFGGIYDRLVSTNTSYNGNTGGAYLSIQRNFSEHVGVRVSGNYLHFKGNLVGGTVRNDTYAGDVDLLYYLVPVEPISPYISVGVGGMIYKVKGSPTASLNKSFADYKLNMGFGAEWNLGKDWKVNSELAYSSIASSKFDGAYGTNSGGILGGTTDSYMSFKVGFTYYFAKGAKSHLNDEYEGVSAVDYNKIEDIVKQYATKPTEVDYNRIADIVKNNTPKVESAPAMSNKWVLIGVNFNFNSATLKPESIPVLYNAAEILLTHPDIKVEIQGYTDNIGSKKANQKLSLERANSVKNFLVAKGVDASRMTTVGMGESNPIMSNKTAEGRALNRRIEFKVQ